MNKEDIVDWFTAKKEHIPIKEGKTKKEALDDFKEEHKEDTKEAKQDTQEKKGVEDIYNSEPIGYDSQDDFSLLKANLEKLQAQKVVDFVQKIKNGETVPKKIEVAKVNDRERKRIEELTGQKLNATTHTLNRNEVAHILKRHGKYGTADHSMANINDFAKIQDVIHNFDTLDFVYKNGEIVTAKGKYDSEHNNAKLIMYTKKISASTYYIVEAITDAKGGDIQILTMYQNKKSS